jgi:hypothetical protein
VIKKTIGLVLVFLLSFAVFLIATLPASVVWKYVIVPNTKVLSLGVQARAFEGSVWDGRVYLSFRHLKGILDWDLSPMGVFSGTLPLELKLESSTGKLSSTVELGLKTQRFTLSSLELALEPLNVFTKAQRLSVSGDVFAKDVELIIRDRKLESAMGSFTWSGGAVSYPAGRDLHERVLPPFSGRMKTDAPYDVHLGIRDQDASFDVMRGSINERGEALWEVTRRVLDIADEPWSPNSKETDVVFKVKKPLYSGLSQ